MRLPCHLDVTQNTTCRDAPPLSQMISGRPDVPPTDKRKRSKNFAATAARTKAHGVFPPRFMTAVQSTQGGKIQTTDIPISYQGEISYRENNAKQTSMSLRYGRSNHRVLSVSGGNIVDQHFPIDVGVLRSRDYLSHNAPQNCAPISLQAKRVT